MAKPKRTPEDNAALRARVALLRDFADKIAATVEALPDPETYRDGERAARTLMVADRIVCHLPEEAATKSDTPPARQRLRDAADRLLALVTALPQPQTHLEAIRAGRFILSAERLFTQLYSPPVTIDLGPPPPRALTEDEYIEGFLKQLRRFNGWAEGHAERVGNWFDGETWPQARPADPHWLTYGDKAILDETDKPLWDRFTRIAARRANAITQSEAHATGRWPDGKAFDPEVLRPDYWAVSRRFAYVMRDLPTPPGMHKDETPCGNGYPWWLVHIEDSS